MIPRRCYLFLHQIFMSADEEIKQSEVNPDVFEAAFEMVEIEETDEYIATAVEEDEEEDELDIAFDPNNEGYW